MNSSKAKVLSHTCEQIDIDKDVLLHSCFEPKCRYTFIVSPDGNENNTTKFGFTEATLPDGSLAKSKFYYTKSDLDSSPRHFSQTNMLNIYQAISEYCLQNLNDELLNGFCAKYLDIAGTIAEQIQANHYAIDQTIHLQGKEYQLTLCTYAPDISELDDIDYVMFYDNFDLNADYVAEFASNIVNLDSIVKEAEHDKEKLIEFYQKNNLDSIIDVNYDLLTEEEKDLLSFFSDWYKDVFGSRPHNSNNMVQQILDSQENEEIEEEER